VEIIQQTKENLIGEKFVPYQDSHHLPPDHEAASTAVWCLEEPAAKLHVLVLDVII
jgi:hypothetical protein